MALKPTISWDEAAPSGSQERSLGATRLRELKTQVREVLGFDHIFNSSGQSDSWGHHNKATFGVLVADPLPDADTGVIYSKDVSSKAELHWVDEDDQVIQLTSGGQFVGAITGEVRIYRGLLANIPATWALCDGVSNPLNLVGKFIRGVATGATDPGGTGGSDSVTLSIANIISHTHTLSHSFLATSAHTHNQLMGNATGGGATYPIGRNTGFSYAATYGTKTDGAHTHTISAAGSGSAFENRPAYLEEAYIIKT